MNDKTEITVIFHMPAGYVLPHKDVLVHVTAHDISNPDSSRTVLESSSYQMPTFPWRVVFTLEKTNTPIWELEHSVNVSIFHKKKPLLLECEHVLTLTGDREHHVFLSPEGYVYADIIDPPNRARSAGATWSAVLHEADDSTAVIGKSTSDWEETGAYVSYDPARVKPGKRYAITGYENDRGVKAALTIHPEQIDLTA